MDIVYLYTAGADTTEIRYSVRSISKHLTGFDNLYIIGDDPGIFKNVTVIPCEKRHKHNKARNIYERILRACQEGSISDHFFYNSDDIYLLRNYEARYFPYYYCNQLQDTFNAVSNKSTYKTYVEVTLKALQERDLPTLNFNGHSPIVYHKGLYIDVMSQYDWEKSKGYISKSLYCNTLKIHGVYQQDCKIHTPKTKTAIYRKIKDTPIFSTDDQAMNDPMRLVLQELYPERSPWEI